MKKKFIVKSRMTNYNNLNFNDISISLTQNINKLDKQNQGIYFTPPKTIYKNIIRLKDYFENIKNILEPSCGSCEFINLLNKMYSNKYIDGFEYNNVIYDQITKFKSENINLINDDFINYNFNKKYDLIIGNPPYFVIKDKKNVDEIYYNYFDGRANIFILFIIKSLNLLNNNGILSFILPKNFLNCCYYNKTRKFIIENFNIIDIISCDDKYLDTQQETIILIIQKNNIIEHENFKEINKEFYININENIIFGLKNTIINLTRLYQNSTTLNNLNFKVNVGNIVWNQCKELLTNDENFSRLIYNSDIKDNSLIKCNFPEFKIEKKKIDKNELEKLIKTKNYDYVINYNDNTNFKINNKFTDLNFNNCLEKCKNELNILDNYKIKKTIIDLNKMEIINININPKKNYINSNKEPYNGVMLIVNRGYGKGNYNFNYCLINQNNYFIENHLICIKYKESINEDELIEKYNKIIKSLDDKRTKEFVEIYFGNNAINTNELQNILPIYLN